MLFVNCLPDEQEMYAAEFTRNGFDVVAECTADVASDYAVQSFPVAVVVDVSLPGGGLALVERWRADPEGVLIVVLSSYCANRIMRALQVE